MRTQCRICGACGLLWTGARRCAPPSRCRRWWGSRRARPRRANAALFAELRHRQERSGGARDRRQNLEILAQLRRRGIAELFDVSRAAQLRFDNGKALLAMKALIPSSRNSPRAGTIRLHAFPGRQLRCGAGGNRKNAETRADALCGARRQGNHTDRARQRCEAQAPLKRALEINPWLKERRLIDGYRRPQRSTGLSPLASSTVHFRCSSIEFSFYSNRLRWLQEFQTDRP